MGLPAFLHPLAVWRAATRWTAIFVVITPPGGYRLRWWLAAVHPSRKAGKIHERLAARTGHCAPCPPCKADGLGKQGCRMLRRPVGWFPAGEIKIHHCFSPHFRAVPGPCALRGAPTGLQRTACTFHGSCCAMRAYTPRGLSSLHQSSKHLLDISQATIYNENINDNKTTFDIVTSIIIKTEAVVTKLQVVVFVR